MNTKHSHRYTILLIISLVSVVGSILAYIYMWQAVRTELAQALSAREQSILEMSKKSREHELTRLYELTSFDRSRLRSFFISSDAVVSFIEALEALGPQTGSVVSLSEISAEAMDTAPVGAFGKARARINALGSWASVQRVLMLGESLPYKIHIDRVRLDGAEASSKDSSGLWRLSFDIEATLISATSSVIEKQ